MESMAFDDRTEVQAHFSPEFPCLEIVAGPRAGSRFPLQMGKNLLGRSAENDIILEDSSVSRNHAAVERTPHTVILTDNGSRNGTKVNGDKIAQPVPLDHDGRFRIGLYEFRLLTADAPPAVPTSSADVPKVEERSAPVMEVPSLSTRRMKGDGESLQAKEATKLNKEPLVEHLSDGDVMEEMIAPEAASKPKVNKWLIYVLLVTVLGTVGYFGRGPLLKMFKKGKAPKFVASKLEKNDKRVLPDLPPDLKDGEEPPPETAEGEGLPVTAPPAAVATTPTLPAPPTEAPTNPAPASAAPIVPDLPATGEQPVFLDFSATPLPADVYFGESLIGTTPFRSNTNLRIGKTYEAKALFKLPELNETIEERLQFVFPEGANVIPIHFAGKMGVFKVSRLPRDAQLYLEGYFEKDPYKPRPIKFSEIVFGKPIYLPFGRYLVELRRSRQLGTSQTFLDEVVYHREFFVNQDQTNYTVEVKDEDLARFPIQITSLPSEAKVFIDEQPVGATPYSGDFPVGEHVLTLKHEGYFDYSQIVKMNLNTPYSTEVQLKTSEAGELINKAVDLIKQERHSEALPVLVESFSKNPTPHETAQISYLIGLCYLKQKQYPEATSYFTKAAQHPDYLYAGKLGLATLSQEQGDTNRALSLLVEVLLGAQEPKVRSDAGLLFQKVSPLKSVLYVTSDPVGATVLVNGTDVQQVTPLILHDLALGAYRIEAKKDGYQTVEQKLNLGVSEFQPVLIKLLPQAK